VLSPKLVEEFLGFQYQWGQACLFLMLAKLLQQISFAVQVYMQFLQQ
jgi:hypothetical protein